MSETKRWNPQQTTKSAPLYLATRNREIRENGACMQCKFFPLRCRGDSRLESGSVCALLVKKTAAKKEKARKRNLTKAKKLRAKKKALKERNAAKEKAVVKKTAEKKAKEQKSATLEAGAMDDETSIPLYVARYMFKRRHHMRPSQVARLKEGLQPLGAELRALYQRCGGYKVKSSWFRKLDWPLYESARSLLISWSEGLAIRWHDRKRLKTLIRMGGGVEPTDEFLLDYPSKVKLEDRGELEDILERARHRPFGRRARFQGGFFKIPGRIRDFIDLLTKALDGGRGKSVHIEWTPRMDAARSVVSDLLKYERLSDEERTEVDRKKAKHEADMLELNAELAKMWEYMH